ncbi:DUF914-domain-containing protein [Linderina pennispora]|uniref:DUF914-domain-containing protein n=1 Tax=Linderina pennispora TaxID=61395 RepID=A0A1Y1W6E7_9FUNG|nr:DUF914-domain-containing protein [Linderina pennispora]ORX69127.1 DUF914-domain-containing protein [Linderina pennispora]
MTFSLPQRLLANRQVFSNWRHFVLILVIGQILSLCITSTSVLSNKLANYLNVTIPNFQSFLVYLLLLIVWLNIKQRYYWYILLAAVDVEGNYFVVKAYSYTSLLSCMLLDTMDSAVVRFRWTQILGVLLCLGGMGLQIKGDMDNGKNYSASDAAKGDIFMLIGATCYAVSNTTEEFIVKHRPQYETVAWLGFFGTIINGVQMAIIEHKRIGELKWTGEVVGYTLGFDAAMLVLYSIAPFLFRLSSAYYMFHDKITPIYAGAFVMIVSGLFVYHVFPYDQPQHMANVWGFRTPVIGDLDQRPVAQADPEEGVGSDIVKPAVQPQVARTRSGASGSSNPRDFA